MAADPTAGRDTPRGAHLEMVGAVLAGDGLERVAEIASAHAGAPVAVVVPRLGVPARGVGTLRALRGAPASPAGARSVPPTSRRRCRSRRAGASSARCCCSAAARPDAGEYLHMAAIAALTEVAVVEARDETEQTLRGSFLEELLTTRRISTRPTSQRRAARLGCDLAGGFVALCAEPERPRPRSAGGGAGRRAAGRAGPGGGATRSTRCCPGPPEPARRAAARLGRHAAIGMSSYRSRRRRGQRGRWRRPSWCSASRPRAAGRPGRRSARAPTGCCSGCWRAIRRRCASFFEDTVAPLVRYDEQYATDLVGTARGLPRQQLQHERDRPGDPRAPPHGGLPAGAGARADRAGPAALGGPRAPRPRA